MYTILTFMSAVGLNDYIYEAVAGVIIFVTMRYNSHFEYQHVTF